MSKHTDNKLEDFDQDEWGNLGEDDILDPGWIRKKSKSDKKKLSKIAKETYAKSGSEWHKQITQRNKNKSQEWIDNIRSSIIEKQTTPEYREQMRKKTTENMDNYICPETGLTLRQKITIANRKSAKDPVAQANRTAANRKLHHDPNWQKAHKQGCLDSYAKKVQTPYGICDSIRDVATQYGGGVLNKLPHLFYFLDEGPGETTYVKIINTPLGKFFAVADAYNLAKQTTDCKYAHTKKEESWWMRMCSFYPDEYFISMDEAKYFALDNHGYHHPERFLTASCKTYNKESANKVFNKWIARLEKHKQVYSEFRTKTK